MTDYDSYLSDMLRWHDEEPEPENPDTGEDRLIYERLEKQYNTDNNGKRGIKGDNPTDGD